MPDEFQFYDAWKTSAPESDDADPPWGECAKCQRSGHLYSLSPVGYGEVCNACLGKALEVKP